MANIEHLNIFREGIDVWNRWRKINGNIRPDLSNTNLANAHIVTRDTGHNHLFIGASVRITPDGIMFVSNPDGSKLGGIDLHGADLRDVVLMGANLYGANLYGANLYGANLLNANLSNANLSDAILSDACLSGTDLSHAVLNRAILTKASLGGATLRSTEISGADFSFAKIGATIFGNIDLSSVKGLETIEHQSPSTVGIDTFNKSHHKIPRLFLYKAGVQEAFIESLARSANGHTQYHTCFISFSSKDEQFVEKLYRDLEPHNIGIWYAPEDLKIGDHFPRILEEAIRSYDKLLLVLSTNSIHSSWVEREVRAALEKEEHFSQSGQPEKTVLFPIKIDNDVEHAQAQWAAQLRRERHIGDFTHWRDQNEYHKALARLLRDLQSS